jgi:hypothetical protein
MQGMGKLFASASTLEEKGGFEFISQQLLETV